VAVLVEATTDNKNRTAAEVRSIFAKSGGQLAGAGSVAWQFEVRGVVSVPQDSSDTDEIALLAIDAGASDVDTESDPLEIATEATDLESVRSALEAAGVKIESAELTMQAKAPIEVDVDRARQNLRLIELLEDNDDVQRVTANFDLPDEILAEATAS
jgi:YebC/PmpR family DNA-binding regulatory protein